MEIYGILRACIEKIETYRNILKSMALLFVYESVCYVAGHNETYVFEQFHISPVRPWTKDQNIIWIHRNPVEISSTYQYQYIYIYIKE